MATTGIEAPFQAAQAAIERTRRSLFPVRLDVWLVLGFVAFLDQLGRSSLGVLSWGGWHEGDRDAGKASSLDARSAAEGARQVWAWVVEHWPWLAGAGALVLAVLLAVAVLVLWLQSRATFVYLDDVARGRAELGRPWREHARRADSYFFYKLLLTLLPPAALLALVVVALPLGLRAWREGVRAGDVAALAVLGLAALLLVLAAALAHVLQRDFVAPVQVAAGLGCAAAWGRVWRLLCDHPAVFVVYLLVKLVFLAGLGMAAVIAGCLTCCLGFLPIVSHALLQPLHYFERAWSLELTALLGYRIGGGE
jgi:hypothetical protein